MTTTLPTIDTAAARPARGLRAAAAAALASTAPPPDPLALDRPVSARLEGVGGPGRADTPAPRWFYAVTRVGRRIDPVTGVPVVVPVVDLSTLADPQTWRTLIDLEHEVGRRAASALWAAGVAQ